MSRRQTERLVDLGAIGRPHGVRGEVRVYLHNPGSNILRTVENVLVEVEPGSPRPYRLLGVRETGKHQLVAFEGLETRDAADRLKGARLLLPRDQLPELEDDEFYVDDLIGLEVMCENQVLGTVRSSREQGGVEVLSVVSGDEELEIPLVEQYVVSVAIAEGRIRVSDVDELPRTHLGGTEKRRSD